MKKLLALDIGEVCIRLNHEACLHKMNWADMTDIPAPLLKAANELECGRICEKDFYTMVYHELNIPCMNEVQNWFCSVIGDEMPGMAQALDKIKDKWNFVFLSDISEVHLRLVSRKLSFFNDAAGGIYSFRVGARKPAGEMYLAFERSFGKPDFYVDDRECNIEAARKRGWPAWRFSSAEEFGKMFEKIK